MLRVAIQHAGLSHDEFARVAVYNKAKMSRVLTTGNGLPDEEWARLFRLVRIISGILDTERHDAEEFNQPAGHSELVGRAIKIAIKREQARSTRCGIARQRYSPELLIDSHFTVSFTPDNEDEFLRFLLSQRLAECQSKPDWHFQYHFEFFFAGVVVKACPRYRKDGKKRRWVTIQFQRPRRDFRPAFTDFMPPQFRKWVTPFVSPERVFITRLDIAVDYDLLIHSFA